MSMYNMIHGTTSATFFILPMLGKHPDSYPRFRDCFISDDEHPEYDNYIHIYTRTGGGNREDYETENEDMVAHLNYITDFDDSFDSTYASWIFSVPEEWKNDFDIIKNGELKNISDKYKDRLYAIYPKLKDNFDKLFSSES